MGEYLGKFTFFLCKEVVGGILWWTRVCVWLGYVGGFHRCPQALSSHGRGTDLTSVLSSGGSGPSWGLAEPTRAGTMFICSPPSPSPYTVPAPGWHPIWIY